MTLLFTTIYICLSSLTYIITIHINVSFSLLATYHHLYNPQVDHIPKIKANQIIRMHRLLQAVTQAKHHKAAILARLMAHKVLVDHQMVLLVQEFRTLRQVQALLPAVMLRLQYLACNKRDRALNIALDQLALLVKVRID